MIYIQSAFSQEEQRLELVGRQGEGGTRQLVFDCADVLAEYPDALIVCAMQRAGDRKAYLKDCAADGANRAVTLESADVAVPGILRIELRALIGDDVRKSAVYIAKVAESLRGEQDKPGNPTADVLNRIDMTISRAEKSIAEADSAAKSAQTVADIVQAKLDNGDFVGPAGKPGSDASVTAENIQSALGYTPVKDVQVAGSSVLQDGVANVPIATEDAPGVVSVPIPQNSGIWNDNGSLKVSYATDAEISSRTGKRKAIVCANMDYAVKAAMCDGKGAAWTSAEQKAARERMGVDKAYELIESITTDGTSIVEREVEPNGTPYNFSHVIVVVTSPKNMESAFTTFCDMRAGDKILGSYAMFKKNVAYFTRAMFLADVVNGILSYKSTEAMIVYADQQDQGSTDSGNLRQSPTLKFASNNITKIKVYDSNFAGLPASFLIQIYGVRA